MAQVICSNHPGADTTRACPHVNNAMFTGQHCSAVDYREYSVVDGDLQGLGMAAHLCADCIAEMELPPSGTLACAVAEELFFGDVGDVFQPTCAACVEEWRKCSNAAPKPSSGFIDPTPFPFVEVLESNWNAIREEYLALRASSFDPWVQGHMHGGGWTVFGLFAIGQRIPAACEQCPRTADALQRVPGLSMAGFSRLDPRTHVKPHVGWAGSVYRLHLALVVPPECRLRVLAETRSWQEGRCLIFDDTVEHEAWNNSDSPRGVLMLDFLRPGAAGKVEHHIPDEVRQYVDQLFAAKRL
jgi:hypothetical protein